MDSLYSRQVGTIGKNAMAKLLKLKILIIGCDTIGVECAKSLALMGVKKLYLYDNTIYNKYLSYTIKYQVREQQQKREQRETLWKNKH